MTMDRQERLLRLARAALDAATSSGRTSLPPPELDPDLRAPGASFVTLRTAGTNQLRGCIGSLEPTRPLGEDVAARTLDAAFRDPRFPPLARGERVRIEVSILGPLTRVPARDYADLVARAPVGLGLLVTAPGHRATYLPAVWHELPDPGQFLALLWQKAGLRPGSWPEGICVQSYEASEASEE